MAGAKITLYVDVVSPFGYLAYWMLRQSQTFKSCEITYVPILLGGVMKATGNTAPLFIKNKDKWINKERMRWATQFEIPMRSQVPPGFPINTVTVMRLLCALQLKSPQHIPVALDRLYNALWSPESLPNPPSSKGTEYDMKDAKTLAALLSPSDVLGQTLTQSIIDAIGAPESKSQLSKNTDEALANGAFGLPWFHCTNSKGEVEGFWGFDHLGQVVRFLGLQSKETGARLGPML